jgi:hypothetical protein
MLGGTMRTFATPSSKPMRLRLGLTGFDATVSRTVFYPDQTITGLAFLCSVLVVVSVAQKQATIVRF